MKLRKENIHMIRDKEKLTEAIKLNAHLIASILLASDGVISTRPGSAGIAKITAYNHIADLLKQKEVIEND